MQRSLSTHQKFWTPSSTIPSYYLAKNEPLKEKAKKKKKKKKRRKGALRTSLSSLETLVANREIKSRRR